MRQSQDPGLFLCNFINKFKMNSIAHNLSLCYEEDGWGGCQAFAVAGSLYRMAAPHKKWESWVWINTVLFYDWELGNRWTVPAMALPGNVATERNKRRATVLKNCEAWFYWVSPANPSRKDFSQWAVNATFSFSESAPPPLKAIFMQTHICFVPFSECSDSAIQSNVIFKVPSEYEVIHQAFYFNCSFLFAHSGWTL